MDGKKFGNWKFGLLLMALGVLGTLAVITYFLGRGMQIPLSVVAFPGVLVFAGLLITFTNVAELFEVDDEIGGVKGLVEDDWNALLGGQFTSTHLYLVLSVLSGAMSVYLFGYYQKWEAHWGRFSVLGVALAIAVVTVLLSIRSEWFQDRYSRLPGWFFGLVLLGLILVGAIGVRYAEPAEYGGMSQLERNQLVQSQDYWSSTRSGRGSSSYYFSSNRTSSADIDIDCDGEGCLGIAIIILVVLCVAGSALIPHFWVVALTLLWTLFAVMALRELLYVESRHYRSRF